MWLFHCLIFAWTLFLCGCGSALPDPHQGRGESKHGIESKRVLHPLQGRVREDSLGALAGVCSSLGVRLIQVPHQFLMTQSIRIPDFTPYFADGAPPVVPVLQQRSQVQFLVPIAYHLEPHRTHEVYFVWSPQCENQRIIAAEFQYSRVGTDHRIQRGKAHRSVSFHQENQLWYIPLSKIFSPSEKAFWGVQQSEADLHKITLKLRFQDQGWKTYEVFFYLHSQGSLR